MDVSVAGHAPGRAGRALRTRLAVQRAAIELCLENGYAATSAKAIAERAGVSERTLFRTFPTKAAIFWYEPFLSRVIRRLAEGPATGDPVAALGDATRAVAAAITPEEWRLERGRRAVILREDDLVATGTQELDRASARIAELLTPADAPPDLAHRTTLFARFAAAGFGVVPIYSDTTTAEWGEALACVVRLAARGPLPAGPE
ncbi:MAG TPA: helix-turn-helix domain-containing protein [Actinophytocola sp.]|jgi:AcrR family transcriptional regulator|nr:helix-turn-helix domain-containing protein [Actinophytocola sp.]